MPGAGEIVPARRLVVLIPSPDVEEGELARQIWTLAAPRALAVLYLGFCPRESEEARLRRRLTTLAALTRDDRVRVDTLLSEEHDWVRGVTRVLLPGDIMVCHAEQSLGYWRRPLSHKLLTTFNSPVYTLSGFYSPLNRSRWGLIGGLGFWTTILAIAAGFFWLQVQMDRFSGGWVHTLLLCLSVAAEFGLIWLWQRCSV